MQLIHLFWQPSQETFHNTGTLFLWIEHHKKKHKSGFYPYQHQSKGFTDILASNFKLSHRHQTVQVNLPCDANNTPIPSPIIANLGNIENIICTGVQGYKLNAIAIHEPLGFLKELNFLSYHFDDDMQLADDAKFWIQVGYQLSHVIKRDLYVPALVAQKLGQKTQYHTKWEIMSPDYNAGLAVLAKHMPYSACLGEFKQFTPQSGLQHFSDVVLQRLIFNTKFSQKHYKSVENTCIEECLGHPSSAIIEDDYKAWQLWYNNLSYEQHGAAFTLCFKLIEATDKKGNNWGIELLLQSKQDPSFMVSIADYWQQKSAKSNLYSELLGSSVERMLLLQLGYASRIYTNIEQIFAKNMQAAVLTIDHDQAFQFLKEDSWALQACGYKIIVPAWWTAKGRLKAKVKLRVKSAEESGSASPTSHIGTDSLLAFDYNYAMGEHQLTEQQWQQLLDAKSNLIYFRGEWVEIDKAEMANIQKLIETSKQDRNAGKVQDLLQLAADNSLYDVELDQQTQMILDELSNKNAFKLIETPNGLNATLRSYQARGVSWLAYLEKLGMNPCLADDMGLGKTMQIIALMLADPKATTGLLIAPTSVVGNWLKEIQKFAPSIKAVIHHGSKRKKQDDFKQHLEEYDLIITSYGLIRRDNKLFKDINWSRLIIDEAQNIKNPTSAQTKTIFSLTASSRIALTGTPIENRLMDLWSIFNFLNPSLLGTKASFRKTFELPVQRDKDPQKSKILKNIIEPFILRRLKTDRAIIPELPDKVEQKVYCELTTEQASIYQSIVDEISIQIEDTKDDPSSQKMLMLSSLLRLKQCCNHPAQVLQDGSEFTVERSIKLQRLVETVHEAIQNNESILIFSQFTEICQQLQKILKTQLGYHTHYLHGGTSRNKREQMIEIFQDEKSPASVFILSLKAGGVGITLTRANHVIHFDRWWNPAVENQATDRAYRIGQSKTVFAHKFITLGTIEEKIDKMLEDKQKMADSIVGNDESWLAQLDANSFVKLIQLSREV